MKKFSEMSKKSNIAFASAIVVTVIGIVLAIALPLALKPQPKSTAYELVKNNKKDNFSYLNQTAEHNQIVLIGDSITEIYNTELFNGFCAASGKTVYNRGISGDTSDRMLERLAANALDIAPSTLVILIGTNDGGYGIPIEKTAANVGAALELTRRTCPDAKIVLQAVYPVNYDMSAASRSMVGGRTNKNIAEMNALLKAEAEKYQAVWLDLTENLSKDGVLNPDFCYDGLHLNAKGFKVVTDALVPLLV